MSTKHERTFYRLAASLAGLLTLAIAGVIIHGDRVEPTVKHFNWEGKALSVTEDQLVLTFNREMDKSAVEAAFTLEPSLDGQFSWAGRKLYYTLSEPMDYGQSYTLSVAAQDATGRDMIPFESDFTSFEQELFYIHAEGSMRQVVSYQPESQERIVHTPKEFIVTDFDFVVGGQAIVFLAYESAYLDVVDNMEDAEIAAELYWLDLQSKEWLQLTDESSILTLGMMVAPNGETIALERVELDPETGTPRGLSHIWIGDVTGKFKPYWYANLNAREFDFTPDSTWLLVLNEEGYSLLPLDISSGPPQFLGNFLSYQGFSQDGSQLAFTRWKDDNVFATTDEVVILHRNGDIETVLPDLGEIKSLSFNHAGDALYATIFESYLQDNALYRYDLKTDELIQLTEVTTLGFVTAQSATVDDTQLAYQFSVDTDLTEVRILRLSNLEEVYSDRGEQPRWR